MNRFSCMRPLHLLVFVLLIAPMAWGLAKPSAPKSKNNPPAQKQNKKGTQSSTPQPPVTTAPTCSESLDVTPAQDSKIVLPGPQGDTVRLQATLNPCGAPLPGELKFSVTRSEGGAGGVLGNQRQEKPGSYVIDWKPGDDGKYRIEVSADTPGKAKKEVTVTVVTSCTTQACDLASHECTRRGCEPSFLRLVFVAPTQGAKLLRGELASVQVRLERKPEAKTPYPGKLKFQVTRSEGGKQVVTPLEDLSQTAVEGTYSNLWTPAEAGEYTLKMEWGGLSTETKVQVGSGSLRPLAWAGVGVGAASVGGGVVLGLLAGNVSSEIEARYKNGAAPSPSEAAEVGRQRDQVKSLRTGAVVSASAGAVLAAAGGAYLWFSDKPSETKAPGTASLSIGPGGVGVQVLLP